jgi:hypothetical protein
VQTTIIKIIDRVEAKTVTLTLTPPLCWKMAVNVT